MAQIVDAIYEDGVFIPVDAVNLAEHQRVRLTVETTGSADSQAVDTVRRRRQNRLLMDEKLAEEIASSGDFDLFDCR